MDERKQRILHAVIQDYIKTAEPVGSRTLAKNYNLGISPATVRNEMSDLEDLGFLEQPHTSAGRIPSAKGYRYYVDSMMEDTGVLEEDTEVIHALWQANQGEFDGFLLQVAKLISKLSHNVSMLLAPAHDTSVLKFIHVLPIDSHRAVMVVVTNQGALDNEPVYFTESVDEDTLAKYGMEFSNAVKDQPIGKITLEALAHIVDIIDKTSQVLHVIAEALYRAIAKRKLFYTVGTTALLEQPEFKDIKKVQPLLSLLEEQDQLGKLLVTDSKNTIDITIGGEHELMKDISVIQANIKGPHQMGTLAILGPIRMEYGRIIGILTYMQRFISTVYDSKKKAE